MTGVASANPDDAIVQIIRHWPKLAELANFAVERRGFGDDNGGFGLIYPDDLDDYARGAEQRSIPSGWVEIYGFWGVEKGGYEFVVEEKTYLASLAQVLRSDDLEAEARLVESLFEGS